MQFVSPGQNNNNNLFEKNLLALSPMGNKSTSIYSHKLLTNYNLHCENTIHIIFMGLF
ncbi:hypothetical protein NC652_031622 [Populus alba x Populus x berolinensis]|uniref:Uncharacterized protein n=1 Tax=Populus alba x Populus x berolinensis TaxID=444605 RepID=A0AAD6LYQ3_9ROSI|nr:hypothetical protein NC652_031622 [Populus alba x Populus x berolinensis]KAJ6975586.1 hypothetical protein NC653_031429 [Populus alba x Populus x berolinensis]